MQIELRNEIQMEEQIEVVLHSYEGDVTEKNGYLYLVYQNEENEKVMIKLNQEELQMTRYSEPKSVMRFMRDQDAIVVLPTPVGLQHLRTRTSLYQVDLEEGTVRMHYSLLPLESDVAWAQYQMTIGWKDTK